MEQRRLAGGRSDQLKMGMGATVVRACQLRAGMAVVARRGGGRAMVLSGVMVREVVSHLGEEEAYPKEKGEQEDREARTTQMPHRGKIIRDRDCGSRLLRFLLQFLRANPGILGHGSGRRCSVSDRFRAT